MPAQLGGDIQDAKQLEQKVNSRLHNFHLIKN